MSNSNELRNTLNRSVTSTNSSYSFTSTYTTTNLNTTPSTAITTSTTTTTSSSNIVGIHSQPYRNYLTERNHFYHSSSQPTTFTTSRPSTIISTIQTNQTRDNTTQQSSPTTIVPKHQQSLFSAFGIRNGSKQSLDSTEMTNHRKMASSSSNNKQQQQQQHRSNSSLALDGAFKTSTSIEHNIDDEYDLHYPQQTACSKFTYGLLWILAQIGLFGSVSALIFWSFKYDKGFAYQNDKRKMYNLHAFLMLTGFIFVNGQSILIYKTYLCCKKIYNKILHAFFFVISIGLVSFGFLIGFQAQSISSSPDQQVQHFYSLHSWIGLVACALFALQFLFGFITFLVLLCCDRSTAACRAKFLPTHITFGLIIFILAIAACLAGLLQTARSRLVGPSITEPGRADYRDMTVDDFNIFSNAGIVINLVGACLILLAILMPYLILNFNRNRPSTFQVN